ncbi:non-hydrolyzing UDP-N-acetylglucosamine 2-epimerase [Candidatus Omnitrophota bacterium]
MPKSKLKKVILVCGARPNFMKVVPLWDQMKKRPGKFLPVILHTGQHYHVNMSDLFFKDLGLPKPDICLDVGSASHAVQTAKIMIRFEQILAKERPDLIIVVGDVNSTLACAVVASKLSVPIAHVESGLRSFDKTMPEEINRIVTDHLSDFLFTTCKDADDNLRNEGIAKKKVFFVGNVMIDTLIKLTAKIARSNILDRLGLARQDYAVLTLHRPSNVDEKKALGKILGALKMISKRIPIVFPAHPRTVKQLKNTGLNINYRNITILKPLGYRDFLKLCMNSKFVLTDSGGIQEETTYLNIPCLTLRENTERPNTVKEGTNILVGSDKDKIISESLKILSARHKTGIAPELWDGRAAERIVKILEDKIT